MQRKSVPALGVFIATMLFVAPALADKIAFVDIQRAIADTNDGKAALAKLKGEAEAKQKELDKQRDELKRLDEDLAKQAPMLKPDALEKKKQELQQKLLAWQEAGQRSQKELAQKQDKASAPILDKVQKAIVVIATRDKYSMVLRQEVLLWPKQSDQDITAEVIKRANEMK